MSRQPIWSGVERAGLQRRGLVSLLARQIAREHIMADGENAAVAIGAKTKALDGVGAMRRNVEYLLPCQRDLHRALELSRRERRQYRIGIDPELAAEAAADEGADQPHMLDRNFQGGRHDF